VDHVSAVSLARMADTAQPPRWAEYQPIDQLQPAERNAKAHDQDALRRSVELGGFIEPVVLDERTGLRVPSVCATATALPFADDTFDIVFSSFGALQFVADGEVMVGEVTRVLRPGGTFAFSITHPIRWSMPDDPTKEGLVVTASYWDRTPYVEEDDSGQVRYVEHHRTIGDWVGVLSRAGFVLRGLLEPEWPEGHDRIWGGWGPERGALIPGTAIFVADYRP